MSGVTYDILYDILIKQNGDIHSDWDGSPWMWTPMKRSCLSPTICGGWLGSRKQQGRRSIPPPCFDEQEE